MSPGDTYLLGIVNKYAPRDLTTHVTEINELKTRLIQWASSCYIAIVNSGSRAKGTAISLASDVDYLVSLTSDCNASKGGLKPTYNELYTVLNGYYPNARKQNVSIRLYINGLEIDVTPARKQTGNTNYHSMYVSKLDTWKQTNVQKHITDISQSGRLNEIKILKIWRELHGLDFPSVYLEYLLTSKILLGKAKGNDYLASNVWFVFGELAKNTNNPLSARVEDPANSANILSDLLTTVEKNRIIAQARTTFASPTWGQVVW